MSALVEVDDLVVRYGPAVALDGVSLTLGAGERVALNFVQRLSGIATLTAQYVQAIEGTVPNPLRPPRGCRFAPRCPHAMPICHEADPPDFEPEAGHRVRCWLHGRPGDEAPRPAPAGH